MGKGSAPRKFSVDHQTFSTNWDTIFGKKSNARDKSGTGDQVHSGERTTICPGEGQQGIYRELFAHSKKPVNE